MIQNKSNSLVTIVIPYFNLGKYVETCITSCLNQSYKNIEIILVNDGSDDTYSLKELTKLKANYKDKIIFIDQTNQGLAATRNNAIKLANGKYIACIDADDYVDKNYIKKLVNKIKTSNKIGIVSCWAKVFESSNYIWETEEMTLENCLVKNTLTVSSLFRKKCWEDVDGYNTKLSGYQDWDFWISIISKGYTSIVIPEVLFFYRDRKGSMLKNSDSNRISIMSDILNKHKKLLGQKYLDIILSKEVDLIYSRSLIKELGEKLKATQKNSLHKNRSLSELEIKYTNILEEKSKIIDQHEKNVFILNNEILKIKNSLSWKIIMFIRLSVLDKIIPNRTNIVSRIKNKLKNIKKKIKNLVTEIKYHPVKFTLEKWPDDKPLVSIIIPCFNYGKYLNNAIDSVLSQTFQNFEIIVVNDGSTDEFTKKVLSEINNPKIKVIHQVNSRLPTARNNGTKVAKGKYICCLDADDMIAPTYLEKTLLLLETNKLDVCGSWLQEFEGGSFIWKTQPLDLAVIMKSNSQIVSSVFTKSIWEKVGGYSTKMEKMGYEDWEFWINIAKNGGMGSVVEEPLFLYRKHGVSMIDNARKNNDLLYKTIKEIHKDLYTNETASIKFYKRNDRYIATNPLENMAGSKKTQFNKRNILFALPYTIVGGADKRFRAISKKLVKNNFHISFVTSLKADELLIDTSKEYSNISKDLFNLPNIYTNEKEYYEFVLYLIKTRGIGTIFLGGSKYFYEILPKLKVDFPHIKIFDQQFNTDVHFTSNRKYSKYIDHTIAENENVYNELVQVYNETSSNVTLIQNGVDLTEIERWKTMSEWPIGLPHNKFIVSFIGRLSEEKGPDIFIKIADKLRSNKKLFFVLAGPGPEFAKCQDLIDKLKLNNKILLTGMVHPGAFLNASDVLVLTSRVDGRPNTVLEALSMGKPVISSSVGGLPTIITNGSNGYLCESENIDEFAGKISLLSNSKKLYKKIADNCLKYSHKYLDDSKNLDKYLTLFK
ncbi:MAG: glycosyltransferase [Candidatus Shapirobacteria bacterium]